MRFKQWMEETSHFIGAANSAYSNNHWDHGWQPDNAMVLQCIKFLGQTKGTEGIYAFTEPMREAIVVAVFEMASNKHPGSIDQAGHPVPAVKQRMQQILGNMRGIDFLIEKYRVPIVHAWERLTGRSYFSKSA